MNRFMVLVGLLSILTACAGTSQQTKSMDLVRDKDMKFGVVTVDMDLHNKPVELTKERIQMEVIQELQERESFDPASKNSVHVTITDCKFRSTGSAIMLGVMSGVDTLRGEVILKDASGKEIGSFSCVSRYGLGGLVGGQTSVRIYGLCDTFGEEVATTITGDVGKDTEGEP
jgi:hypothetical protein